MKKTNSWRYPFILKIMKIKMTILDKFNYCRSPDTSPWRVSEDGSIFSVIVWLINVKNVNGILWCLGFPGWNRRVGAVPLAIWHVDYLSWVKFVPASASSSLHSALHSAFSAQQLVSWLLGVLTNYIKVFARSTEWLADRWPLNANATLSCHQSAAVCPVTVQSCAGQRLPDLASNQSIWVHRNVLGISLSTEGAWRCQTCA